MEKSEFTYETMWTVKPIMEVNNTIEVQNPTVAQVSSEQQNPMELQNQILETEKAKILNREIKIKLIPSCI